MKFHIVFILLLNCNLSSILLTFLGKFNDSHYFLKPLELQREERMDMTQIPSEKAQFEAYVNQHLLKKDLSVPYLLNEYIQGEEYAANVICKNGNIYMFQVS